MSENSQVQLQPMGVSGPINQPVARKPFHERDPMAGLSLI